MENLAPGPARLFTRMIGAPLVDFGVDLLQELGGDHVAELVGTGLVAPLSEGRYQLHGLVRGRVDEDVLRTVLDFFLVRANSLDSSVTLAWFADERANLLPLTRAALAAGLHEAVWRLGVALTPFYRNRPYLTDWLELTWLAIEAAGECADLAAEARLRATITMPLMELGRLKQVAEQLEQAQVLAQRSGDLVVQAYVWTSQGRYLFRARRFAAAQERFRMAIGLYRKANDKHGEAVATYFLSEVIGEDGELALAGLRAVGDEPMAARALVTLGERRRDPKMVGDAIDTLARKGLLGPLAEAHEALARVLGDVPEAAEQRRLAQRIIDEHS